MLNRGIRAKRLSPSVFVVLSITLGLMFGGGCAPDRTEYTKDGRIILDYWEKWGGFEADAMRIVVDRYNESQDQYFVRYVPDAGAQIDRKLMLSIAGGNPPDLAGFWDDRLVSYVQNGALTPLDEWMKRDGLNHDDYLPNIITACQYEGFTWALPLTPATLALFYNKEMFREAGLDPERPPQTIEELTEYALKITKYDEQGRLVKLGFSPNIPGWWNDRWIYWFGGKIWDGESKTLINSPESLQCYQWLDTLFQDVGIKEMDRIRAAADNFDSPQWPFFSGRVAMVIQGVWMPNFIQRHAPDLDWGAAPFPSVSEEMRDVTLISNDILVIPRDCSHPEGAWDFMRFTQRPENMEILCLEQQKFTPLKEVSEGFYDGHPNKAIRLFRRLAESPNAHIAPQFSSFWEIQTYLNDVFYLVTHDVKEPKQALANVEDALQQILDRALRRWNRVKDERKQQWAELEL